MPPIAPRINEYSESDVGAGAKLSNTSRHAIAPICPTAPIVCRNFIARRMANALTPINVSLDIVGRCPIREHPARQHVRRLQRHDVVGAQHAVEIGDQPVGLAQPHAVERVADRARVGKQRLGLAQGDVADERLPRSALNL